MRNVIDIYNQYKILPNLQLHQLKVASVAMQICDSIDIELKKGDITITCLLHDMGNIIKFDFTKTQAIFGLSDAEIEISKKIQQEFFKKYGNNEYEATRSIAKELWLTEEIIDLLVKNDFNNMCKNLSSNNWTSKILQYADSRVGPKGVLSFDERIEDGRKRYENDIISILGEERDKLVSCGKEIEKQIFENSKIKPEDITNESIKPYMERLKDFEI